MHRTSTRSPPFLKEDESIWRTLRNYTNKKRIMMKYKKLWKTMIHSLKDKCFTMHFTELQDTKRRQMTSPHTFNPKKWINPTPTHHLQTQKIFFYKFFLEKCSKMFENEHLKKQILTTSKNDLKKHPKFKRKALVLILYTFSKKNASKCLKKANKSILFLLE